MAASNNLASLEPWTFRATPFPDSWISDAFSRETETFTKALQQSLSSANVTGAVADNSGYEQFLVKSEPVRAGSVSDPDMSMFPKRRNVISNGKITKRKSRASKRSPTTFIAADPANFRQMVQQVTGIQFGEAQMPVTSVLKPEPHRPGNRIQSFGLPTLDTSSAFLVDNNRLGRVGIATQEHAAEAVEDGGASLEFGNFHSFPTLESWREM